MDENAYNYIYDVRGCKLRTGDTTIARWMCMDPLAEKYYDVSPYVYCKNNPVNRIDPDGMDDYFSNLGIFQKHTDEGDAILVQARGNKYVNINEIDFSNQTKTLINIGTYYLSQLDNNFLLYVEKTGGSNPLSAGMATEQGTNKYYLMIDAAGKVNNEYGNASNLLNSFYHETKHRYDKTTWGGGLGEVNAIIMQTEHKSWDKVSNNFAQSQASYAAGKLNVALNREITSSELSSYINQLNTGFAGIAIFTIENGTVTVTNQLNEIKVYGIQKNNLHIIILISFIMMLINICASCRQAYNISTLTNDSIKYWKYGKYSSYYMSFNKNSQRVLLYDDEFNIQYLNGFDLLAGGQFFKLCGNKIIRSWAFRGDTVPIDTIKIVSLSKRKMYVMFDISSKPVKMTYYPMSEANIKSKIRKMR